VRRPLLLLLFADDFGTVAGTMCNWSANVGGESCL